MIEALERTDTATLLATLHAAVDALISAGAAGRSEDEQLAVLRSVEQLRRKLPAIEHDVLLDLEAAGTHLSFGARTMTTFLAGMLNLDAAEAGARMHAARACGRRRSLTGEVLAPLFPLVAAGQAAGQLCERERRIITDCVDSLPDAAVEMGPTVEAELVGFAATMAPRSLKQAAERISYLYDQDGAFDDVERRRKNRDLHLTVRPDGSSHGTFEATAELTEFLQVVFDALAAPQPESNGQRDTRTPGQRRHDGLLDALRIVVGCDKLTSTGGVLATLVLTMTTEAYATGEGFARTGHGAQVPVAEALSWAGGDYRLMVTALDSLKAITAYSSTHRLFTEGDRLAMIARDGGCAFPGCSAPPGWTQAHHVTEWQDTHRTCVDDGCLLCGWHHREFERLGWRGGHRRRPTRMDTTPQCRSGAKARPDVTRYRCARH
ncbi:DUF222 domain-containing protein [uncultured Jatrophihabitans sp.]|uniref:HNH endonuclease signature motif containing protein n=1 Tax=uncultured Jatrophihabitans sp. TaxID=1610747 RepID=UPI0035CBABD6